MKKAIYRAVRTLAQLIAAGGLTALVDQATGGLSAEQAALVLTGWGVFVTFIHNLLENVGAVPPVLKQ